MSIHVTSYAAKSRHLIRRLNFKGNDQYIVHKQTGITADASTVMARARTKPARKVKRQVYAHRGFLSPPLLLIIIRLPFQDELASFEQLSTKALAALQDVAVEFMDSCFEGEVHLNIRSTYSC